jgi:PKD repeat protein
MYCAFFDTITFSIFPQSIPAFVSDKDGINFNYKKDTLCANSHEILYLRDTSYTPAPFNTAQITQREWNINNYNSTSQHIIFNESAEGLYDVNLHIVNQYNCASDSVFKEHILINKITALFIVGESWYCNHTQVDFHDRSFISPRDYNKETKLVYIWDFGDGTPLYTSTETDLETKIVYHTYNLHKLPDTVAVTLTVSLPDGSCYATYTDKVLIKGPIASFIDDGHRYPCPESGRSISFQSTSTGNPTLYYWNFGDSLSGSANESYLKNPIHDYRRVGWYDVLHIVKDSLNCADTLAVPSHVFIDGPIGDVLSGELSGCV